MKVSPARAWGAASMLTLLAACTSSTDTSPASSAAVVAPGTPTVSPAPGTSTAPGVGTSAAPLAAPGRIGASEISSLVAGNTAAGIAPDGQPYYAWFGPGGQLRFRQGGYTDVGTWRIGDDGLLCTAMTKVNGGLEECYVIYRTSTPASLRFDRLDGTTGGHFSLLPGNPQAL
jgi:hypothetical protein